MGAGKTGNGGKERGKHGKVGVKRKWWVLAQSLYSPQGNLRQSPRVKPERHTTRHEGEPRKPVSSKDGRTGETVGAFQIHSRKTRIIRARAP